MNKRTSVKSFLAIGAAGISLVVAAPAMADVITGTAGPDTLIGTPRPDSINGRAGADTIDGRGSNDTLHGGRGADRIFGGPGADLVIDGRGRDTVIGERGPDALDIRAGADVVSGGPGNDNIVLRRDHRPDLDPLRDRQPRPRPVHRTPGSPRHLPRMRADHSLRPRSHDPGGPPSRQEPESPVSARGAGGRFATRRALTERVPTAQDRSCASGLILALPPRLDTKLPCRPSPPARERTRGWAAPTLLRQAGSGPPPSHAGRGGGRR